jgi:hypothetical protein
MKYDIYFIEVGFMLSYLDPKFKGKTKYVPSAGDFIDYEIQHKDGCVIISGKVMERIHYLQDDKVQLRVSIGDKETLEDLNNYIQVAGKIQ